MELTFEIITLSVLIALSGFFSGLEVALVGVTRSEVHQMLSKKLPGANSLHKLKSNPSRMMASVNLGNNLVNVASTALATDIALKIFENNGLAIVIGAMSVANAVDATLTKLFPRLTLAIILLGLDFSL
jgi:Mg2+/Co2+ transporter CorB